MKEKIRAEWVAALRSGKYEQGRGALQMGNTFCCLGVLCQLAPSLITRNEDGEIAGLLLEPTQRKILTWSELLKNKKIGYDIQRYLSSLNDSGFSFIEIADFIESNL